MRVFSNLRYPPGGFKYTDPDGILFTGSSVANLVGKVAEYREANHFPAGDPFAEVNEQLCNRFPAMAVEADRPADGQKLVEQVVRHLRHLSTKLQLKREIRLVSPELASRRAEVCFSCPHNVDWKSLCRPCQLASTGLIAAAVGKRKPAEQLAGRCCTVEGFDLSAAVWLHDDAGCHLWPGGMSHREGPPVDDSPEHSTHQG